jgi:hypothetical protein
MSRTLVRISTLVLFVLVLAAAGCSSGSSAITPIEGDVPAGMPAMYEFYTDW